MRTDGRKSETTDTMTMLLVAFHNFANAPKKAGIHFHMLLVPVSARTPSVTDINCTLWFAEMKNKYRIETSLIIVQFSVLSRHLMVETDKTHNNGVKNTWYSGRL